MPLFFFAASLFVTEEAASKFASITFLFVQGCDQYFYGNGGSGVIQSLNFDQPSATYVATLAGNVRNPRIFWPLIGSVVSRGLRLQAVIG